MDIYILPNVKPIAGGKQLHSTGRSAWCFVTIYRGGIGRVGGRRKREEIGGNMYRSEEHTSELQSHSDLVCRLLLEKKNQCGLRKKEKSFREMLKLDRSKESI